MRRKAKTIVLSGMLIFVAATAPVEAAERAKGADGKRARSILDATGVKGGLVVHLGCGSGELTAALRADESYVVQGLDRDTEEVEKARQYLQSEDLNGPVSVLHWDKSHLPYVNNLANLVVSEDPRGISMEEVMRVLAPLGVAYVKRNGEWVKKTKPRPEEIDDWTHGLHDAGNNAVSRDSRVGPPRSQQWFSEPKWSRHHEQMTSISALVSSGNRLFYIVDKGSYVSPMLPSNWRLVARDANNGMRLWSRPMGRWASRFWPMKNGPSVIARRLVAMDDAVYVTLGINAPVSVLDAASGKTLDIYKETAGADEFVVSEGTLFAVVGDDEEMFAESEYRPRKENITHERNRIFKLTPYEQQRTIVAVDTSTGDKLWQRKAPVANLGLAADANRVVFHDRERVVCLDRANGGILWQSEPVPLSDHKFGEGATLVLYKDVVLFSGDAPRDYGRGKPALVTALSADSGTTLWQEEYPTSGHRSAQDVFAIGDAVWAGQTSSGGQEGTFCGRDARTGELVKTFDPDVDVYWFHHRCHRGVATENYILTSRTGVEFVDWRKEQWDVNHWVRGTCHFGIMPANGLLYAPPHPCACYMESKLTYFNALAPASGPRYPGAASEKESRLERGPAFGKVSEPGEMKSPDAEWPTFRCDNERSGYTPRQIPARLKPSWE
ncbi:MAG: PQQ-binding-like beta-propeller repeat protein, partial [Planctomycetota bacterium]